ncbi:uncharacterized protein LOC120072859 isoform X2 [Benincasa hispida]|uniref:uncharacterized protein LOC120072859 isoform X2 n=1 Tax=Benincasa hispida TaxID=102211 RepID=UPI0019019B6D|nr:uncharacterized protein LOC120072859 isoform X2 [Benincasa hispida]
MIVLSRLQPTGIGYKVFKLDVGKSYFTRWCDPKKKVQLCFIIALMVFLGGRSNKFQDHFFVTHDLCFKQPNLWLGLVRHIRTSGAA